MSVTPIPLRVKIDAILYRAALQHIFGHDWPGIYCDICRKIIMPGENVDFDHWLRENAGGATDYMNIRPLHRECHKEKRRVARSKATTLGKDNYEAKKGSRIAKGPRQRKGRAIRSRGFQPPTIKPKWPKRQFERRT